MRQACFVLVASWMILGGLSGESKGQAHQAAANERVMKLIRAHESALGLIHQFDIQFEIWHSDPEKTAVLTGTSRWARKGDLERIRAVDFVRRDGSGEVEKVKFADQLDDGKQ